MPPRETVVEMAERHVREGERHVAIQRRIVCRLDQMGFSTELATQLLKQFEEMLDLHRQHLKRLQRQN